MDLYGVKSRYSYHQLIPTDLQTLAFEGLVKYDHDKATREVYHYPRGWFPSETSFARSTRATAWASFGRTRCATPGTRCVRTWRSCCTCSTAAR